MVKLTRDELLCMSAFQTFTGVLACDCVINEDTIVFVVKEEDIGTAIGKNGLHVKKLSDRTKKKIQVFAQGKDAESFIRLAFKNHIVHSVTLEEKEMRISVNNEDKKKILQNKWKFNIIKEIMKRSYGIENIKIK